MDTINEKSMNQLGFGGFVFVYNHPSVRNSFTFRKHEVSVGQQGKKLTGNCLGKSVAYEKCATFMRGDKSWI